MAAEVLVGDAAVRLADLTPGSIQTCITSPPYWGLRDYGVEAQLGSEPSLSEYVDRLVDVMELVRRALADDGTLWLNLGDTFFGRAAGGANAFQTGLHRTRPTVPRQPRPVRTSDTLKERDLVGAPWSVAFALRDAGWYLRSEVIWAKPNPLPESVGNRPTKSHETVFLFAKRGAGYYWNAENAREPASWDRPQGKWQPTGDRNMRSVVNLPTQPSASGHPAPMPLELARRLMLATSRPGDRVLDCFAGSGTVGEAALQLGRVPCLVELNPDYARYIEHRLACFSLALPFTEGV